MSNDSIYDANFTAGGLLFNEFVALEELLLSQNFDDLILIEKEENKTIGIATKAARTRIVQEVRRRYDAAPEDFWVHFFGWNEQEQKLALFYLCLKVYPLIFDIHFEVTLKKFKVGNSLDAYDIQMRLDEIASLDEEVASWSDSTYTKINTRYRRALKDVGLFNGKRFLKPTNVGAVFWNYFQEKNESWFLTACFKN